MKNLSIVFFFLMTFAFMSVNAQAQTNCKTKKACKKVCTKTNKTTTQTKAASNTFDFLNVNSTEESKAKKGKKCCKGAGAGCCILPCSKKGAKATTTSVTSASNKATAKEPVAALKPKSN